MFDWGSSDLAAERMQLSDRRCNLGVACRAAAKLSLEGKEYVVRDGDVIHFKFNV